MKPTWTIAEALTLVNQLWTPCETHGYHIALTGGVLKYGSSNKDVDFIIYPRESLHTDYRPCIEKIYEITKAKHILAVDRHIKTDYKLVICLLLNDQRRIDLLIPNFTFAGRLDTYTTAGDNQNISTQEITTN
jgi:hypothetical protein